MSGSKASMAAATPALSAFFASLLRPPPLCSPPLPRSPLSMCGRISVTLRNLQLSRVEGVKQMAAICWQLYPSKCSCKYADLK